VVVQEGDEIDGGVVAILDMGPMAVYATGQIAFWARLSGRDAIVRADPARGPGSGDDDGDGGDSDDAGDATDGGGDDEGIGNADGEGGCLSIADNAPSTWCGPLLLALISISFPKRTRRCRNRGDHATSRRNLCVHDRIAEAAFLDSCHRR